MKGALDAENGPTLNFFYLYDGCLMDVAVISWCKCFGSRKEALHWTKLNDLLPNGPVKDELDAVLGQPGALEALSKKLRNYRDTYVAHHDLGQENRAKIHPRLAPLRDTGTVLYGHVFGALSRIGRAEYLPPPDGICGASRSRLEAHWRDIAQTAKRALKDFTDVPRG